MKKALFLVYGMVFATSAMGWAAPEKLATTLTASEIAREALDEQKYPHFMPFLKSVDVSSRLFDTDPRNAKLVQTSRYFEPTQQMWNDFFKAAAADHLTCLRAFGLLAREI